MIDHDSFGDNSGYFDIADFIAFLAFFLSRAWCWGWAIASGTGCRCRARWRWRAFAAKTGANFDFRCDTRWALFIGW